MFISSGDDQLRKYSILDNDPNFQQYTKNYDYGNTASESNKQQQITRSSQVRHMSVTLKEEETVIGLTESNRREINKLTK